MSLLYDFFMDLGVIKPLITYNNYQQEPRLIENWVYMLDMLIDIDFTEDQKNMICKLWCHLNIETIKHSFSCVLFGNLLTSRLSNNKFKKVMGCSKKEFLLGLALHDSGKTLVPKDILETDRALTEDERLLITNMHTIYAEKVMKEFFSGNIPQKVVEIATEHHSSSKKPYLKLAKVIDVTEALMSERCYKLPLGKDIIFSILEKNNTDIKLVNMISSGYNKLNKIEDMVRQIFQPYIIVEYYCNYRADILEKPHSYFDLFVIMAIKEHDTDVLKKLLSEGNRKE